MLPNEHDRAAAEVGAASQRPTTPSAPEQHWRIENLQLVNWGGFEPSVVFEFAPNATLVTGMSGTGKSTILDAYIALMMPAGTAFNGASNAAQVGRARSAEQRNLLSYLRGKTDTTENADGTVDKVLRGGGGHSTWGAIAATFLSDEGARFTAARAYWVPAGASSDRDLTMRFITMDGPLDLTTLEPYAKVGEERFPARQLKAAFTDMRTHESYAAFAQVLYTRLGIGANGDGAKAAQLLVRVQAGQQIRTVDELYKEMVLDQPVTFARADEAIAYFDTLEASYRALETERQKANHLAPITAARAAIEQAQAETDLLGGVALLSSDDGGAGLWRLRKHSSLLAAAVERNRDDARDTQREATEARADMQSVEARLEAAHQEHANAGGTLITELDRQIADARTLSAQRLIERERLVERTRLLGSQLESKEEFALLQTAGSSFLDGYDATETALRTERDNLLADRFPLLERSRALRSEVASLEGRTGRISSSLDTLRREAAAAAGLDPAELPFVAELIEVGPNDGEWRAAIETVLYSSARRMLVPLEALRTFSASIDPLRWNGRLTFEGVERTTSVDRASADPQRIAGKLEYKDSPYEAWVREHVAGSSVNALCVGSANELEGPGLRVTRAGQTRRGRGGSHGTRDARNVIGFDNTDLRAELEAEAAEVDKRIMAITLSAEAKRADQLRLAELRRAYDTLATTTWESIDSAGVQSRIDELEGQRAALLAADGKLSSLQSQIDDLAIQVEVARTRFYSLTKRQEDLATAHEALVDQEDAVRPKLEQLEMEGVLVPEQLEHRLDSAYTQAAEGGPNDIASFPACLQRMATQLDADVAAARDVIDQRTTELTRIFTGYLSRWFDPNLGTSMASFDHYAEILEGIISTGLHERQEEWRRRLVEWSGQHLVPLAMALSAAVDDIDDRLEPINRILHDLPFGATGDTLQIKLRRLHPDSVKAFTRELKMHSATATKGLSDDELQKRFAQLRRFMAKIRRRDDEHLTPELLELVERDVLLDVRRHVDITAERQGADGQRLSTYASLGGKSGGETQELIAFIIGAALRFRLGDQLRARPRFMPVFLDEGFIKSDADFAGRAVQAWIGLGFQIIVAAPIDKFTGLEEHMELYLMISKNQTSGHSFVDVIRHKPVDTEDPV